MSAPVEVRWELARDERFRDIVRRGTETALPEEGHSLHVELEDGTELWYCHQSAFGVEPGDQVVGGQPIGLVGATGNTTGPHLHLEVRPDAGSPIDPMDWLQAQGLDP